MTLMRAVLSLVCLVFLPSRPPDAAAVTSPANVGTQIAGTFVDASGHSAQSHLFYAANSGVWWLLTLTSNNDSPGGANHIVKAFHSSGPDLTTATWTAAADSPGASVSFSSNCPNCTMGSGRALGVAYIDNTPVDAVHAEIAMAFDGQNGLTGHIRATVTATSIAWGSWGYHDEPAATWATPRAVVLGVSSGGFVHSGGLTLQQEVDANARVSTTADVGAGWTNAFSAVSVIDNSMLHQCNAMAFAPLTGSAMLAVYDNGAPVEPGMSNLRYKKSNANGSWPGVPVGTQLGGDGKVFSTDTTIDQNDWTLVSTAPGVAEVFRSNASGTALDAASYDAATNQWAPAAAPPPFAAGQALKKKAGVFGATSGSTIWLFAINTDSANSILYTSRTGTSWTPWSVVPGTDVGLHDRQFISGYPRAAANQIGLIWTEGASPFDLVATSLSLTGIDSVAPVVSLLEPVDQSTVSGAVPISADASDDVGVSSVQFRIDGVNQGPAQTTPPYGLTWSSAAVPNGSHSIAASARDAAGNTAVATVVVVVSNPVPPVSVPNVIGLSQSAATSALTNAGLSAGAIGSAPNESVPVGVVLTQSPGAGTEVPAGSAVDLIVSAGVTVPDVVGQTQAAATTTITSVPGLVMGAITSASSTTVAAGLVISQNPPAQTKVSGGTGVAIVVSSGPPPGPGVDTVIFADGRGTRTTQAFSTSAPGEILLAFVAADGQANQVQSATVTGAGLTWTLVRRSSTQRGTSEIWRATADAALVNVTVRSTLRSSSFDQSLTVVAFRNSSGTGASAAAAAASGAPSVSLTTTTAASLGYAVGNDGTRAVARTLGANQVLVHQWVDTATGRTFWVQAVSAVMVNAGTTVQLNDTAPTGDRWNLSAVEIRAK